MKKKRTLILIGAVGILLAVQTITSFAADGKWTLTDAGYTFTYSNGRKARGTWEDIDGEWYHFDRTVPSRRAGSTTVRAAETGTTMIPRGTRRSSGFRIRETGTGLTRTER